MRGLMIILSILVTFAGVPRCAYAQIFSQSEPRELEVESAIQRMLPEGALITELRYEVFSDDERGTGRISVAGTYTLDRDYFSISNGPNKILKTVPKEYMATGRSFMNFWENSAHIYGGDPRKFKEADLIFTAGTPLEFSGNIIYVREVDGFRFKSGGLTKEIPQGSYDVGDAILVGSDLFIEISAKYSEYVKSEYGDLNEMEVWIRDRIAGNVFSVTYETKKIAELWIEDDISVFFPEDDRDAGMVRFAAYATKKDLVTEERTLNNWVGTRQGTSERVVVWGSVSVTQSGAWLRLFNFGTEEDYNSGVSWRYGYEWDESRSIFAGENYDRNTFVPCMNCDENSGDAALSKSKAAVAEGRSISDLSSIVGNYTIQGFTASGSNYQVSFSISKDTNSDEAVVTWELAGSTYSGIATVQNGVLNVEWSDDATPAYLPITYWINVDGNLEGDWVVGGGREIAVRNSSMAEVEPAFSRDDELQVSSRELSISRIGDLRGNYRAVGKLADNDEDYSAEVLITSNSDSDVASILWKSESHRFVGSAKIDGGVLVVKWSGNLGEVQLPIAYKMQGSGELLGVWQDGSRVEWLRRVDD